MIQIRKQDKRSFDIYLDETGVVILLEYVNDYKNFEQIRLDKGPIGFNSKILSTLLIKKSYNEESILVQENNILMFILTQDDIDYLIFRLNQYLKDRDFSPPELFNLDSKNIDITFYLKKISK